MYFSVHVFNTFMTKWYQWSHTDVDYWFDAHNGGNDCENEFKAYLNYSKQLIGNVEATKGVLI